MDVLLSMLAAPAAKAAIGLAHRGATAAAVPFEQLLEAAMSRGGESAEQGEDAEALGARLAASLQHLLTSLGAAAGDVVSVRTDWASGQVEVAENHALAESIEQAIRRDRQLSGDLARHAQMKGQSSLLEIEIGAGASAP